MAFLEDLAEGEILSGNVLAGLAIGAAALVVMPLAAPLFATDREDGDQGRHTRL